MFSFLLILLNCSDRGIASLRQRVQQKQSYLKGIFMVRRWINNKWLSILVQLWKYVRVILTFV